MADARLSPSADVAKGLRKKLDAAALMALQAGQDWAEGPLEFTSPKPYPFGPHLFEPLRHSAEVKAGPVGPEWTPPAGWSVVRNADWVAAGKPGLRA